MESDIPNFGGEGGFPELTDFGPKSTGRTLRVDQVYSKKDHNVHFVPTSRSNLLAKQRKFGKYALVVRRIIGKDGKVVRTEIDVKSLPLRDVLLELNQKVEGLSLHKSPPLADPKLFYHSFKGLKARLEAELASPEPDQNLIEDLSEAIAFVHEDFGPSIESITSLLSKNEITYDYLWALFPPGTIVCTEVPHLEGIPEVLLLRDSSYVLDTPLKEGSFSMQCWTLSHDGKYLGLSTPMHETCINTFIGSCPITELPIFPLEYHPDKVALRASLVRQGREFLNLLKPGYREYSGAGLKEIESLGRRNETELRKFISRGRVMVDPTTFRKYNIHSIMTPLVRRRKKIDALTEDDLLICTPLVLGFSFGSKDWGAFAISELKPVAWNVTAFDKLVLNPQHSKIILSLVKAHSSGSTHFDDIVENKGKGLIGLLSGPPGVGKTLTAEAVAEATHRPLYMLSAGELGTNPGDLDRKLNLVLELGDRWNSVLLVDEADAFLHARRTGELVRNSLVSIFLRQLEYYQGIMILTTNRVHAIDSAFHSRIHFSIDYPDLDKVSRRKIWSIFIRQTQASLNQNRLLTNGEFSEASVMESETQARTKQSCLLTNGDFSKASGTESESDDHSLFKISDSQLSELAQHPLNGRQIKNTIASAISLALHENIPPSISHIQTVLGVISDFADAMQGKIKKTDSEDDLLGIQINSLSAKTDLLSIQTNGTSSKIDLLGIQSNGTSSKTDLLGIL